MGLLTILRKQREREREMRLLILGLDNAGKTTIMKKLLGEPIDKIEPTLGFNISTVSLCDYNLNLWDVGGQRSLRSYWRNYFEQTDGVVWVVDSGDAQRLQTCAEELKKLLQEDRLAGASLVVLANKQDLPGSLSSADIAKALELESIQSHHWKIFPVSAVSGQNLLDSMTWLTNDVASRLFTLD